MLKYFTSYLIVTCNALPPPTLLIFIIKRPLSVSVVRLLKLKRGRKKNNNTMFLWWTTALLPVWGRCTHASVFVW